MVKAPFRKVRSSILLFYSIWSLVYGLIMGKQMKAEPFISLLMKNNEPNFPEAKDFVDWERGK